MGVLRQRLQRHQQKSLPRPSLQSLVCAASQASQALHAPAWPASTSPTPVLDRPFVLLALALAMRPRKALAWDFSILQVGKLRPRQATLTYWSQTGSQRLCCVSGVQSPCFRVGTVWRGAAHLKVPSSWQGTKRRGSWGRAVGLVTLVIIWFPSPRDAMGKFGAGQQREAIQWG